MNRNFSRKDELRYEICIRGINSDVDVQTLRRLFRSVVAEGLPVDLGKISPLGIEELYTSVASKVVELQTLVVQLESGSSLWSPRVELGFPI
jgi:hypothetical protein